MNKKYYWKAQVNIQKRNSLKESSLRVKLQAGLLWFEVPKQETEGSPALHVTISPWLLQFIFALK